MLKQCHDGNDVHFEYPDAETGSMVDHHICPTDEGEFIHDETEEPDGTTTVISATVIHDAHRFTFAPNPDDSEQYLISVEHTHEE